MNAQVFERARATKGILLILALTFCLAVLLLLLESSQKSTPPDRVAQSRLAFLRNRIIAYYDRHGALPSDLNELRRSLETNAPGYLFSDPWGRPHQYNMLRSK